MNSGDHKEQIFAGLQVVGGAIQIAIGAGLIASGVGAGLGLLVAAHGLNSVVTGGADMYFASSGQKDKIGSINLLKDGYKAVLVIQLAAYYMKVLT